MMADFVKDMYREEFTHEFVTNSADPGTTLKLLRKLLRIVLDITLLLRKSNPALVSAQMCMLTIRCLVESLDQEWVTAEGIIFGS